MGINENDEAADKKEPRVNSREKQVLMLTAEGLKLVEIGERMGITLPAVKMLKHRAMDRIGIRGTPQLMRYAFEQGWIKL